MIFLTDGEFYCAGYPNIPDVIDEIAAQEVRVVTIAFGASADKNIQDLAIKTGGSAYFVPDDTGPTDINNALSSSLAYQPTAATAEKEVILIQETFTDTDNVTHPLIIDQFSGRDVSFSFDIDSTTPTVSIEIDLTGNNFTSDQVIK